MLSSNLLSRALAAAPGRAALTVSAVALAAAGLAACSASAAPATSSSSAPAAGPAGPASSPAPAGATSPAAAGPSGAAASGAAGAAGAAAARGPDVCSVLTSTRVASITGDSVGQVTRGHAGTSATCSYSLSKGAASIEVEVAPHGSPAGYSGFSGLVTAGASPPGSASSEPGLGQRALASSFGVAVQGARYAYLVLNAHGQLANPLGSDLRMARILVSALG